VFEQVKAGGHYAREVYQLQLLRKITLREFESVKERRGCGLFEGKKE
jgi:hypothetical protein